jgi:hypothetical protein
MTFLDVLIIFVAISFLYYGLACIYSRQMVEEFVRYGVPQFRRFIGLMETLGALGLLFGYLFPIVQILAAAGLALLMLFGCLLRIKIRDSVIQILPAFVFMLLNLFVLQQLIY